MMTNADLKQPVFSGNLKQAVAGIMNAAAAEGTALSGMLDIEHEILDKAKKLSANLEEFVAINESVNSVLKSINKVQLMTQIKLQYLDELLEQIDETDGGDDDLEE
jgi:hypothetical protein